jgi:hypothetical protein
MQFGLFWKLNCSESGCISEQEFMTGWSQSGFSAGSESEMKRAISDLRNGLARNQIFAPLYTWLFQFNLEDKESNSPAISVEAALAIWRILLPVKRFELTPHWLAFVEQDQKEPDQNNRYLNYVSKDLYMQFWMFIRDIRPRGSNYSADDGWPTAIDGFVDYLAAPEGPMPGWGGIVFDD